MAVCRKWGDTCQNKNSEWLNDHFYSSPKDELFHLTDNNHTDPKKLAGF